MKARAVDFVRLVTTAMLRQKAWVFPAQYFEVASTLTVDPALDVVDGMHASTIVEKHFVKALGKNPQDMNRLGMAVIMEWNRTVPHKET